MSSLYLHIIKLIKFFLPETRCFGFKRILYRLAGAKIGKNVRICSSARILGNGSLHIGDNTWIGPEVMIVSTSVIQIGANVDIGPRVFIGTGTHEIDLKTAGIAGKGISGDITVNDGCWLGANSTILPGINLSFKCIVAAGAVVSKNCDQFTLVGGVPAKVIRVIKEI